MLKTSLLFFLSIALFSTETKAQEITPTDLIQLFKYWRMDVKDFDRNTNDCLQLIDKKWIAPNPPDTTDNGFSVSWLYLKKPKEIPMEYGLIGGKFIQKTDSNPLKVLIYKFKGKKLWNEYQKQMQLMGAVNYNNGKEGDGMGHFFATTSLKFILTENPPGINGKEVTYNVSITPR